MATLAMRSALSSILQEPTLAFSSAYALTFTCGYRYAVRKFGSVLQGGTPRWRNILGLLPQLVVMPSVLVVRAAVPSAAAACDAIFARVFGSLIIFDFAAYRLGKTMVMHHAVCLAGHALAISTAPAAFGFYHAAVVALEVGSGTSCMWWAWGETALRRSAPSLYAIGMSTSNALAAVALLGWSAAARPSLSPAVRAVPALITAYLVYLRQVEMQNLLRYGKDSSSTG